MQSRREILRTTTVGAGVSLVTVLAGCSDETSSDNGNENGDDGTGNGDEETDDNGAESDGNGEEPETEAEDVDLATDYVDWVYDFESVSGVSRSVTVTDMGSYANGRPDTDEVRRNFEAGYDEAISVDDTEYVVDIGYATVLTGTFDAAEVAETMELSVEDSYEGFDLYASEADQGPVLASDGDYLVKVDGYSNDARGEIEALIDTYNGDADRFVDINDPFERIAAESDTETADQVSLGAPTEESTGGNQALVAYSQGITLGDSESAVRILELYDDEDAIDTAEFESQVEADEDAELTELSQDGRLLTAELTFPTEQLY